MNSIANWFSKIWESRTGRHLVFPDVPENFWRGFRELWEDPLRMFEESITLAESFGANPQSPRFQRLDDEYWAALRSLHSRTCLHSRAVLVLLANGLVDPAWVQWRLCHEASVLSRFLAIHPERAVRYLRHSAISKNHLAQSLINTGHFEAPTDDEAGELEKLSNSVKQELADEYGRKPKSRNYSWSGLSTFAEIESEAESEWAWKARPQYILASDKVHANANAGRPVALADGSKGFLVGATNAGLTDPLDLSSLSLLCSTVALLKNAVPDPEDNEKLRHLLVLQRTIGAMAWISDPAIRCYNCDGYVVGARPPKELPPEVVPPPCECRSDEFFQDVAVQLQK